jgi:AraC family transcriptional regulator
MKKSLVSAQYEDSFKVENMRPDITPPTNKVIFDSMRIDDYHLPPQLLDNAPIHNSIIISNSSLPLVRRELGGDRKEESFNIGHTIISPAQISHSACWDEEASFTVITLETKFFEHMAHEYINPDSVDLLPHFAQADPFIYSIGQIFSSKMRFQQPISRMYLDQMATTISVHLLENYCSIRHKFSENNYELSGIEMQQIVEYIQANLHRKLSLEELGNLLGMSRYHFARLFKKTTGNTPAQYITQRRLERAIHLLKTTNLGVGSIARQTGFYDHSHLCRIFRENLSGATPDRYRKN